MDNENVINERDAETIRELKKLAHEKRHHHREAAELYMQAAALGDTESMRALAHLYTLSDCDGLEKNMDESRRWLEKAAALGDAVAQFQTASFCLERNEPDGGEEVLRWLNLSAEGGCARSIEALALFYMSGKITDKKEKERWDAPKDLVKAAHYLERLVELRWSEIESIPGAGDLWELPRVPETLLAQMYMEGEGVEKDVARGLWLHRLATISGSSFSMKVLWDLYENGAEDIPQDFEKAAYWMIKYHMHHLNSLSNYVKILREAIFQGLVKNYSGDLDVQALRIQFDEAFNRGVERYQNDMVEKEWERWIRDRYHYNDWYHRGYGPDGRFVLSEPNPYDELREDKKRAAEYLASL